MTKEVSPMSAGGERSRRRPWKVRGWSFHWNDYEGGSFATEEKAMARAQALADEGLADVRVWSADEPRSWRKVLPARPLP